MDLECMDAELLAQKSKKEFLSKDYDAFVECQLIARNIYPPSVELETSEFVRQLKVYEKAKLRVKEILLTQTAPTSYRAFQKEIEAIKRELNI